jgi:membrane dipeptidase
MKSGKIASLLGVEGSVFLAFSVSSPDTSHRSAHQIGNSLAVLRQYYALGVRYMTLTHVCHNAFADSCGFVEPIAPLHNGLRCALITPPRYMKFLMLAFLRRSDIGHALVHEMNRLGMLIDISHTSDATALQTLKLSRAPVIWSHSSARTMYDVARNVPDNVLALVGEGEGKTDAVVMVRLFLLRPWVQPIILQVNFVPFFLARPGNATVTTVADHVEHIAKMIGKNQ